MIKKLFITFLLIFSLIGNCFAVVELDYMEYSSDALAQAAYVGEAIDQLQTAVDATASYAIGDSGGNDYWEGQGFQLSGALTLTAIEVKTGDAPTGSPTGNWTVRIETNSSGKPSGTLADANATTTVAPSSSANTVVKATFATPFALSAATTYFIVITADLQATNNRWYISNKDTGNPYASGTHVYYAVTDTTWYTVGASDLYFKVYVRSTQSFSEATIKTQGSYSLKGTAAQTTSLNSTLTRTVSPAINLTGLTQIKFDIYSSRTGANIKIGIYDATVPTTTEKTYTVISANTWETVTWDISAVTDANKDAISKIIVTVVEATAANTFYLDNKYGDVAAPSGQIIWLQ